MDNIKGNVSFIKVTSILNPARTDDQQWLSLYISGDGVTETDADAVRVYLDRMNDASYAIERLRKYFE